MIESLYSIRFARYAQILTRKNLALSLFNVGLKEHWRLLKEVLIYSQYKLSCSNIPMVILSKGSFQFKGAFPRVLDMTPGARPAHFLSTQASSGKVTFFRENRRPRNVEPDLVFPDSHDEC